MTKEEFFAEGERRFGPDKKKWKFVCPVCGYVASIEDWLNAGGENMIAFSCIGRLIGKKEGGPCDYAGGGLLRFNPLEVDGEHYFNFAEN